MLIGTTKCIVECDKILIFFGGGGVYGLQLNVFLLFVPMAIYDILVKNNVWFFYPKLIFVRSFMLFYYILLCCHIRIRIMFSSGATCQPVDCCFSEVAL